MTRASRFLLCVAVLVGCRADAPAQPAWTPVPATIESVGKDTYASFQPVFVTQLRLDNAQPAKASVHLWGVEGPVKEFDVGATDRGSVLVFRQRTRLAEVVLCDTSAPRLALFMPPAEVAPSSPQPPDPKTLQEVGEMKVTYYWVESEDRFRKDPADTPLLDVNGNELGKFSKKFVQRVKVEGTGKLHDGTIINVSGKEGRFEVVRCPNGCGVKEYHLLPFRSIAVDKDVIPIGTEVFIPAAVGAKLPDGTIHDGHFWAHDVGGGIKEQHIDIFTGAGDQSAFLEKAGVINLKTTKVYRIAR